MGKGTKYTKKLKLIVCGVDNSRLINATSFFRVTQLVIKKPYGFRHSPGDWVRIRIPEIAKFEWHPFTIRY